MPQTRRPGVRCAVKKSLHAGIMSAGLVPISRTWAKRGEPDRLMSIERMLSIFSHAQQGQNWFIRPEPLAEYPEGHLHELRQAGLEVGLMTIVSGI